MRFGSTLYAILATLALGCSTYSPITSPDTVDQPAGLHDRTAGSFGRVLWGMWHVEIDSTTSSAVAIPLRGPAFTCNVTRFIQPPVSPTNLLSIVIVPGSDPPAGFFKVDVTVQHPFPGLNKFGGFDVRGILMADGSVTGSHDDTVFRAGLNDTRLLNADGYTRWWNYPEFTSYGTIFGFTSGKLAPPNHPTATVNPFKYFAAGLDKDAPITDLDLSTRGFFPAADPGVATRRYDIQFKKDGPQTVFDFQYAIDASWALPDPSYAPDYPVEAFSPSANCQEAFAVSVADAGSTAYFVDPSQSGGELKLNIEVFDWQAGQSSGGVPNEVSGIWLEGPVLAGATDVLSSATILPGSTDVSSVYQVTLSSLSLTKSGIESLFGTVESASPNTYEPQVPSGDSFTYPDSPLAAFFTCDVSIGSTAPAEPAIVEDLCARWGKVGEIVTGVNIEGQNFDPACTVELEYQPGDTIAGENVQWIDPGNLIADFNLSAATSGRYDLKVTNPSASAGVLPDAFEVMDPADMPIWPVIQGESKMTGMNGLYGPCGIHDKPTWQKFFQPNPYGNPLAVFVTKDSAYLSNTGDGGPLPACAVNLPDGTIKWNQQFHNDMQNWLNVKAVSADDTVVLCSESGYSTLYGLDAGDGSMLWQTPGLIPVDAYVALDLDGNFIIPVSDVGYESIVPATGQINWTASIGDPFYCTPAVGLNGVIYGTVGDMWDAQLHALDPATGADKWSEWPHIGSFYNGVTVHPNGTILVQGGDTMFCFIDNGDSASIAWQQPCPKTFYTSIAVGPTGDIYIIDGTGTLRRIDPADGATTQFTPGWGDGVFSRPAVGADGLIYTYGRLYMENKAYFICFNPDCTLRWRYEGGGWFTDGPFGPPAIGQDGKVYTSFRKLGLIAWGD